MAKIAKTDRFGQTYMTVPMVANKNGYLYGYFETIGQLYKLEISTPSKQYEDKKGRSIERFIKVTKVKKRTVQKF